ncbi:MAG TPA: homocysteine S-methyltransferase family protein [Candidatus Faecousia excrementigallinarum]|uniref:Homocysteine S-methyltransferase family protein n=1 Tax=Candidatus Faecousia excrementigallinarum TaxID=2840806 RepID=A0A9D0Z142_9FIRM|nr:homocysteine S-methyltransferase family protein [Candidatus Faecousia excrementigallinarum]
MLTKEEFHQLLAEGPLLLDGATGSNLQKAGMPRGCCTEQWILDNPQALTDLQRQYAEAGSRVLYAPTFQAQPIALERANLADQTEKVNARLAQLTRSAAPGCLVAGNLTTLATFADSFDPENFDLLVENYSRQIRGLVDGGVDLLAAETLMYPLEAEAILTAAELEGVSTVMYSFTMQPDGALFSGMDASKVLSELEDAGAAAVGFNCVAADLFTAGLVSKLKRRLKGPILCKPNAGIPVIGSDNLPHYPMEPEEFAGILADCAQMGASILGGCCGTDPRFIAALKHTLS